MKRLEDLEGLQYWLAWLRIGFCGTSASLWSLAGIIIQIMCALWILARVYDYYFTEPKPSPLLIQPDELNQFHEFQQKQVEEFEAHAGSHAH